MQIVRTTDEIQNTKYTQDKVYFLGDSYNYKQPLFYI